MLRRATSRITPHFCRVHYVPSVRLGARKDPKSLPSSGPPRAQGPRKQAGRQLLCKGKRPLCRRCSLSGRGLISLQRLQRHASAWQHSPWAECPRHKGSRFPGWPSWWPVASAHPPGSGRWSQTGAGCSGRWRPVGRGRGSTAESGSTSTAPHPETLRTVTTTKATHPYSPVYLRPWLVKVSMLSGNQSWHLTQKTITWASSAKSFSE